ncbi:pentaheme c-type cytochrome TorC [Pragia fontium]|uniref:pentaheme c-type cytochrome TorC n=1 Tax=Pragia fontium TaxID=82985 RepID=UPI00064B27A3|nr:pentaheme c-type cytochrome TorC [Pragia fontium]AKJ43136.1 trimethylamine N-oxide reductase cytochrome c-type subunit [Pragia fontium]
MKRLWLALKKPSKKWSVLSLLLIGTIIGIALIMVPHAGLEITGSTKFCISCHEMESTVYKEYQQTTHFSNASGVRAECKDCHIPPGTFSAIGRKIEASNDLYQKFITGSIDTPEKFEAKRAELAAREWERMKANNSATCRTCHNYDAMDHAKQHPEAAKQMKIAAKDNQSCIDCHKGIAHKMPDMSSGLKKDFEALIQMAEKQSDGETLYTLNQKPIFASKGDKEPEGSLLPASEIKVLKRDGDWLEVSITGWTETEGRRRVLSLLPGKRIFVSTLRGELQTRAKAEEEVVVPETGAKWSKLTTTAWIQKGELINQVEPIWTYAGTLYNNTCNQCHGAPDIKHYDANAWIGTLKGMLGFTSLNTQEERILLKYLQVNASDMPTEKQQ